MRKVINEVTKTFVFAAIMVPLIVFLWVGSPT
jgi:multidrug efflux pump subunit AcrB